MSTLKSGMCVALILITIVSQLAVPLPHFLVPRWRGISAATNARTCQTTNNAVERRGAQPLAQNGRQLSAVSGFNESWDGCQWGFRGNALICEACAELWAGVGRIWSLKQTSFPCLRLHTANFCRRPDGWVMARSVLLSLHKHVRSTLLDDFFSDRDSSRRLECRGSLSQASTEMRQTASC